ncbi:unnamed protein product [Fusarium graminearum]|uniref:Uncharacterized protein n=1 Tax=Gibberella zeae TaxID=5518 RepID=A0A4E9EK94_GIBZA|nr:unnamed protein product [Fusarium graminearum]
MVDDGDSLRTTQADLGWAVRTAVSSRTERIVIEEEDEYGLQETYFNSYVRGTAGAWGNEDEKQAFTTHVDHTEAAIVP